MSSADCPSAGILPKMPPTSESGGVRAGARDCTASHAESGCPRRAQANEAADSRRRQAGARQAAGDRDEHTLNEQLADDAAATCAEGGPHGDLADSGKASDEEQIGDVDARDEEQQRGCRRERENRAPRVTDDVFRERVSDTSHAPPYGLCRRKEPR